MSIKIDALGQNCPVPVIMAKKAMGDGENHIEISVDNQIATENLKKLAQNNGFSWSCEKKSDDLFVVTIVGEGVVAQKPVDVAAVAAHSKDDPWAVFVTDKAIGTAPNELGESLMKMYFYTLAQGEKLPETCIFMNEGVRLLENKEICQSFSELESRGVKLMFCGACLNFYSIAHLCQPDSVSNMYSIIEKMGEYGKVVKL